MKLFFMFIRGLIQYYLNKPIVKNPKPPIIHVPKKPILRLDINVKQSRKWKGLCWHHSATKDNLVHNDSNAVTNYHTSFRIDYDSVAHPLPGKLDDEKTVLYKNGIYYKKSEYDYYWAEYKKHKADPNDKRSFIPAWSANGYHGIAESVGNAMVFNWCRPLSKSGAHAGYREFNDNYIGLCAIGYYDQQPVPPDVWDFALMTTRGFLEAFPIKLDDVIGHREVYDRMGVPRKKSCPGRYWDMDKFRAEV